jgi:glutathione S-transferase
MTQSFPILYTFRRCPYAMRARLALYTAKIAHEHREVDLKNKPAEMLAISPKGTVPVLQLVDGTLLEQSLDIMKWALQDDSLPAEDDQLITENDTTFKKAWDRYKYPGRYPEEGGINYRDQGETFLKKLEGRLSAAGPNAFLTGKALKLLDMALFPFIRQFVQVDPAWFEVQSYPHLKPWLDFFFSSPLFSQVMQEYSPWTAGDEPVLISLNSI